jgi:type I restriction enzyme M protein
LNKPSKISTTFCTKTQVADSENSWIINAKGIDQSTFDLSVKNPNKKDEVALRSPKTILKEIRALDDESAKILNTIAELI